MDNFGSSPNHVFIINQTQNLNRCVNFKQTKDIVSLNTRIENSCIKGNSQEIANKLKRPSAPSPCRSFSLPHSNSINFLSEKKIIYP